MSEIDRLEFESKTRVPDWRGSLVLKNTSHTTGSGAPTDPNEIVVGMHAKEDYLSIRLDRETALKFAQAIIDHFPKAQEEKAMEEMRRNADQDEDELCSGYPPDCYADCTHRHECRKKAKATPAPHPTCPTEEAF